MKKYCLYSLIGLLAVVFMACKKSQLEVYQNNPRIYFSAADLTYSFATRSSTMMKDTVLFRLNYIGLRLNEALPVKISVVADKTTAAAGTEYELLPSYAMPAGKFSDSLRLVVKRTPGMATTAVKLVIALQPADNYAIGLNKNGKELTFTINDILTKPASWESYLVPYFGAYSKAKYRFMIDTLGLSDFPYDMTRNGQLLYLKVKVATALAAYEKEHGPLVDAETGNTVFFPA